MKHGEMEGGMGLFGYILPFYKRIKNCKSTCVLNFPGYHSDRARSRVQTESFFLCLLARVFPILIKISKTG